MKSFFLSLVFLLLGFQLIIAQDADAIRSLLYKQQDAWNAGDIEGFMEYYWKSDSLCFMTKDGVTNGWQNTLDRYKKGYPDKESMGKLTFDLIRIDVLATDAALVAGKWLVDSATKSAQGYFNLLLRKKSGKWLIVLDHTS
jgi:uncharacterized protein (TIGR02246 family)